MKAINPWINFNGNAEEAFAFYKSVFGGEFTRIIRFKDIAGPGFSVSDEDAEKIMLIALPIGRENVLMANDVPKPKSNLLQMTRRRPGPATSSARRAGRTSCRSANSRSRH